MWASSWNHHAWELDSSSHKFWELGCQNAAGSGLGGDEGWAVAWLIEGASQVGISGEKDEERCRGRPDPDGRAEGDLRGANTGVGMWEMGVREMCQMWHRHFSASYCFPLGHMLRILALSSEYFACSCEETGFGKTNGSACLWGRNLSFWIPAQCLLPMLLLGGGFSSLKGYNFQVLWKGLALKRQFLYHFGKLCFHVMPALTHRGERKTVAATPQQQGSWKSQANHKKCLFIHYTLNLPWLHTCHIPEKQKKTIPLHHDCNTINWLQHYSNQR